MIKLFLALFLLFSVAYPQPYAMAVLPEVTARHDYTGNGVTTVFAYSFKITNKNYIRVLVNGVVQTVDTNFTVSGVNADAGGSITFISGAPASGATVVILRDQPLEQTTTYQPGGGFPARRVEQDLDENTAIDQMQQEQIDRSLKLPETIAPTSATTTVPAPVANKCIGWNSSGTQLANNDCAGGGGGGGSVHSIDGVNLTSNDPINFQDTATIDITNPSAGNVQAAVKASSIGATQITDASITAAKLSSTRGTGNQVQLTTGSVATDDCAKFDANGNIVSAGAACGAGGGGSFTDVNGTANEIVSSDSNGPTTTLSLSPTLDLQSKVLQGAQPLCFEGVTSDAFETCFAIVDPTADRTITFPNLSGRVMLDTGMSGGIVARLAQDTYANVTINGTTNQITVADGNGVTGNPTISIASNPQITGTVNASTGYQVAGAATSGQFLRGDGTKFVGSAIQAADIPVSGTFTWTGANVFTDSTFSLRDNVDTSKVAQFQVSGISGSTTRTFTLPDQSSTLEVTANKGAASGYASLDGSSLVPVAQVPTAHAHTTSAGAPGAGSCAIAGQLMVDTTSTINGTAGDLYFCPGGSGTNPKAAGALGDAYNSVSGDSGSVSASGSETLKISGGTGLTTTCAAGSPDTCTTEIDAGGVTVAKVAAALKTKTITFRIGSDQGAVLADSDDEANIWTNDVAAMHITQVRCSSDAGTPIINLERDDGSAADILSSNLTCATGRAGATSSSFTSGEDAIASGHAINFKMVTAGGSAKRVTITITATLD